MYFSYRLVIAYDGTSYYGWQKQLDFPSIHQVLEDSFVRAFHVVPIIIGASRTDAGVHALGQVALLRTTLDLDPSRLRMIWNKSLPLSIHIFSLKRELSDFHPHHRVIEKTYYYHLFLDRPLPFVQSYGFYYRYPCNMSLLEHNLAVFQGKHDFTAFCTGAPIGDNPLCTLRALYVTYIKRYNIFRITIVGNRFLHHMVRRIVGAALTTTRMHSPENGRNLLKKVLAERNPNNVLLNAPSHGLLLRSIRYDVSDNNQENDNKERFLFYE